jgi:hypothetical protein
MLAAHCPACDVTQLYSYSHIHSLHNTQRGIQLVMDCYCGERFTVLTGRGAGRALHLEASTA